MIVLIIKFCIFAAIKYQEHMNELITTINDAVWGYVLIYA